MKKIIKKSLFYSLILVFLLGFMYYKTSNDKADASSYSQHISCSVKDNLYHTSAVECPLVERTGETGSFTIKNTTMDSNFTVFVGEYLIHYSDAYLASNGSNQWHVLETDYTVSLSHGQSATINFTSEKKHSTFFGSKDVKGVYVQGNFDRYPTDNQYGLDLTYNAS